MEYISKDSVKALSFRYLLKNGEESPPVVMLKSILRCGMAHSVGAFQLVQE